VAAASDAARPVAQRRRITGSSLCTLTRGATEQFPLKLEQSPSNLVRLKSHCPPSHVAARSKSRLLPRLR
jgi:hypothetical protein